MKVEKVVIVKKLVQVKMKDVAPKWLKLATIVVTVVVVIVSLVIIVSIVVVVTVVVVMTC